MIPRGRGPISTLVRQHEERLNRIDPAGAPGTIVDRTPRGTVVRHRRAQSTRQSTSNDSATVPRYA